MELIAVASDDGGSVSEHFSGAAYYVVLALGEERIQGRELRPKPEHQGRGTGTGKPGDSGRRRRIAAALQPIRDCGRLVARSFGDRAYEGIRTLGIQPVATDLETVDEVGRAALEGRLEDHPERVTGSPSVWKLDGEQARQAESENRGDNATTQRGAKP